MISEKKFWRWFINNNETFFFLNQVEDETIKNEILAAFLKRLHKYSTGLFFEIGGHPDEEQELIITAQGNKAYFPKVIELVNAAPKIKNWKIIAFKQPRSAYYITRHNEIELDPQKMWFCPLQNPLYSEAIGIKVFIDNFNLQKKQDFLFAIRIVLDNILGEKFNAENILHIEVDSTNNNPASENIKLIELRNYINWSKKNQWNNNN